MLSLIKLRQIRNFQSLKSFGTEDYLVLSHGWIPTDLAEITAQVIIEDAGRTVSGGRGKPALTRMKVLVQEDGIKFDLTSPTLGIQLQYYLGFHDERKNFRNVSSPVPEDLRELLLSLQGPTKTVHQLQVRLRPEVRPEAWGGEMLSETRPLSAPGSHMDGGPSRQPGRRATSHSAAGLRNEVELSRLKAQVGELQQKLGVAHLEVHQMRDRCDAADAEATLQRSIASTAKAQVAKLQLQLASRAELQVLEEKLRNTEECRASIESEREEERRQLQEKIQLAEVRATELEAELKRQRLSQDDTRALADHPSSWLTICPSKLVLGFSSPMCIASRTVDTAKDEVKRKMNHIITKHRRELDEARRQIGLFLIANSFPKGDTNGKKGVFFVTFPLHESVKQNNAYITAKLLLFGADPTIKDTWGWSAYDYAKGKETHQQILKVFQQSGLSPSAPHQQLRWSTLQRTPPPRGFEEFFAKLANDPLVQVANCEDQWLQVLGVRNLRLAMSTKPSDAKKRGNSGVSDASEKQKM
eukprot:symbB.v1.2.019000.t1/scaffold1535.1/size113209/4